MLKNLPIELLEGFFDDISSMRSGVVVEQNDSTFSACSFLVESPVYSTYLGCVEALLDCLVLLKHLPVNKTLTVPPDTDHSLFWVEILFNPQLWRAS